MPHRMPSPILPGPLTRSAAADLTQALRDLYGSLLGHFTATPPLIYQQGQGGVNYGIDLSVISWPIRFTSTATFLGGPTSGGLILPLVLPGIVTVGSIYYDSSTGQIYIYNGTVWKHYGSGCWDADEAALDADQNNYNPDDPQMNWWRLTRGSSPPNVNVTGIEERDDGCPLLITHCGHTGGGSTPNTITLTYDDAASTSINRIYNAQSNSNAVVLCSGQSVLLRYDVTSFHWRVVGIGVGPFKGSGGGNNGSTGLVPTPASAEQSMFLKAAGFWDYPLVVRKNTTGSDYSRRRLNLIEGAGATLTVADDAVDDEIDVTIAASGGLEVKELDGAPDYTGITVLILDQAAGLQLSQPGAGQGQVTIQAATTTQAGIVSTGAQSWTGTKSVVNGTNNVAVSATNVVINSSGGTTTFNLDGIGIVEGGAGANLKLASTDNGKGAAVVSAGSSAIDTNAYVVSVGCVLAGVTYAGGGLNLTSTGNPSYAVNGVLGLANQTITLAKLTPGGANGSITIKGGIVTAFIAPT